jgi:hypothetical protein
MANAGIYLMRKTSVSFIPEAIQGVCLKSSEKLTDRDSTGTHCMEPDQKRDRLYTRYPFSASAVIIDGSGAQMPSRVANIGFGGCRLIATGRFTIGAEVTVKVNSPTEYFECPAVVVHSTATDVGVMFHNIGPVYFSVLRRWIGAATAPVPTPPQSQKALRESA